MDIEADFEYAPGERRGYWLRTTAWINAFWLLVGLGGLVVGIMAAGLSLSRLVLVGISVLIVATQGQEVSRRLRMLNVNSELSLRFTEAGLSWRNQFVSHQVRWPAVRRVRRSRDWLVFEGTRTVDDVTFPARALSEVQLEELTKWLTAQKLLR